MELKLKPLSPRLGKDIPFPSYATPGSACMDLRACVEEPITIPAGERRVIPCGFAIALPSPDYVALIFARSGMAVRSGIAPANCVGVVDSDYRGEIMVGLLNSSREDYTVQSGDRIAQLAVVPIVQAQIAITSTLDETERGTGGFGSTGRA